MVAWLGAPVLGVANAAVREVVYRHLVASDLAAHQLAVATLIGLLAWYFWTLQRRWPLATAQIALIVGTGWTILTHPVRVGRGPVGAWTYVV
jgi:hypothetical protein